MNLPKTASRHAPAWLLAALIALAPAPSCSASAEDPLAAALEAEIALVDEDYATAARAYARAADVTGRADFAERATQLALYAADAPLAARMASLWRQLAPGDRGAAQAGALAALRSGQADAAISSLALLLDGGTRADLEAVIRTLNDAERTPGLKVLRALAAAGRFTRFEPSEVSPVALAVRWKDLEFAAALSEESLRAWPRSARAWLWQALVHAAQKRPAAAAEDYAQALKLDPGNIELRLSYVRILNEAGRGSELRKVLEAAPRSHPHLYAARLALAVTEKDVRAYKRLRKQIARDQQIDSGERSFLLGQVSELLTDPEQALGHYAEVSATPRRFDARLRMAVLGFADRREQALDWLREVQESATEQAQQGYLLEAELFNAAGEREQAVLALSRGLSVYLDDTQLLYARALTYANLDAVEQVESDLRRVLELEPENAAALNALGYTLTDRTQRHAEAYELIKRAYALNDQDPATLDSLGWVLFRLGRTNEALEYLQKAYSQSPDAEIAAHLGEVLWASGDREAAVELWRKALAGTGNAPAQPQALHRTVQRLAPELLP